ncbi:MAG: type II CAAX endopeptidase family protein [Candidatus Saccharimonadales bacterium]
MSTNYSDTSLDRLAERANVPSVPRRSRWLIVGLPLWVLLGFVVANVVLVGLLIAMQALNVPVDSINSTVFNTLLAVVVYVFSLAIVVGLPWVTMRRRTTRREMGIDTLPKWSIILLTPLAFVVYSVVSALLIYTVSRFVAGFDVGQAQSIGFSDLTQGYQLLLAFITLVILAPVAEEALFRGYLFGKLRRLSPFWVATLMTSVVFAALHLPGDSALQWNVAIDVFALSIILSVLREKTGSIWAGVLLHMLKNGLAFYILFINPSILTTIGA